MFKLKIFAVAGAISLTLCAIAASALAQQPPVDPQIAVYRQLLDDANSRLAQTIVALQGQVAQLQKELAAEKAKSAPKEAAKPDALKIP